MILRKTLPEHYGSTQIQLSQDHPRFKKNECSSIIIIGLNHKFVLKTFALCVLEFKWVDWLLINPKFKKNLFIISPCNFEMIQTARTDYKVTSSIILIILYKILTNVLLSSKWNFAVQYSSALHDIYSSI